MTEAEMVGWHQLHNGPEFEQTSGDSEEQGSLVCCSPHSHKESDMAEQLSLFSVMRGLYLSSYYLPICFTSFLLLFLFSYLL